MVLFHHDAVVGSISFNTGINKQIFSNLRVITLKCTLSLKVLFGVVLLCI